MNTIFLISFLLITTTDLFSMDPRIQSYKLYKQGFKEFKTKDYKNSVTHIEESLAAFPRHKKARELLQELRLVGQEYYNTGIALVYFNTELSKEYLSTAFRLLEPKDIRRKKISRIIERLEHNETHHQQQQDLPSPEENQQVQGTEEEDS